MKDAYNPNGLLKKNLSFFLTADISFSPATWAAVMAVGSINLAAAFFTPVTACIAISGGA